MYKNSVLAFFYHFSYSYFQSIITHFEGDQLMVPGCSFVFGLLTNDTFYGIVGLRL